MAISVGAIYAKDLSTKRPAKTNADQNRQKDENSNTKDSEIANSDDEVEAESKTTVTPETAVNAIELRPSSAPIPSTPAAPTSQAPKTSITPKITVQPTASVVVAPTPVVSTNPGFTLASAQDSVEDEILLLVNAERASKNLAPLASDARLRQAAAIRVGEEAIISYVGTDHKRPDGRSFDTVLAEVGYSGATSWGENLVWGSQSTVGLNSLELKVLANKMFTSWKNSPGHYANMTNGSYNQTGLGVALINQNGQTYWYGIELFARK